MIKRTPKQWYKKLWSPKHAFRAIPPLEREKKKKITKKEYEQKYIL